MENNQYNTNEEVKRKLSPRRVMLGVLILAGIVSGLFFAWQQWQQSIVFATYKPWFAPYVDVTATPTYAFEQLGATKTNNVILSFIVASSQNSCTPTWGNAYTLDQASSGIDIDRRIARLRQQGGSVAISFGGSLNNELAVTCKDQNKLTDAYKSVIDRYSIDTIDLDLEKDNLTDTEAAKRRAVAIASLQKELRSQKKNLAVWVTLPVTPDGLTEDGTNAVSILLSNRVDLAGVNILTMDFGQSRPANKTMEQASENALENTHRQLGILYKRAGINLNSATLWRKIGVTPMIGQNDAMDDVFTLQDATKLNQFAVANGLGRVSMWSVNRDVACGGNYIDTKIVSDSCSGINQDALSYTQTLSKDYSGTILQNAGVITVADADANKTVIDNPATSPYQIWKPSGAYLEGTKVVWHGNVYQAKWWTQGDVPDNPVLQSWQTPWQLIGPVLPGEKPVPQPKLPEGTYPNWSGTDQYDAGQIVLFNETPFQAKWWNQGNSPAIAASNPDNSPWVPLTQKQVDTITAEIKATSSATLVQ